MGKLRTVGIFLVGLLIFAAGVAFCGWCTSLVWNWFVAPLGVLRINLLHAIGLNILVGFLTGRAAEKSREPSPWRNDLEGFVRRCAAVMTVFAIGTGFAFLIHLAL